MNHELLSRKLPEIFISKSSRFVKTSSLLTCLLIQRIVPAGSHRSFVSRNSSLPKISRFLPKLKVSDRNLKQSWSRLSHCIFFTLFFLLKRPDRPSPSIFLPLVFLLHSLHLSSSVICSGKLTDTASSSSSSRSESPQLLSPKEGVTTYTHAPPHAANPVYTAHTPPHASR